MLGFLNFYRIIGLAVLTNSSGTDSMQMTIKAKPARALLVAVEAAIFLVLAGWVGKGYVADALASNPTRDNLDAQSNSTRAMPNTMCDWVAFTSTAPLIFNLTRPRSILNALHN